MLFAILISRVYQQYLFSDYGQKVAFLNVKVTVFNAQKYLTIESQVPNQAKVFRMKLFENYSSDQIFVTKPKIRTLRSRSTD